ncbi:major facilitator superfamily transporter protein [Rutstroemia sp. NJR-2017a BBW]|nr:major facilitator superfamily transporter protein [Rutstroemia sp. NJR-2017a BBW]
MKDPENHDNPTNPSTNITTEQTPLIPPLSSSSTTHEQRYVPHPPPSHSNTTILKLICGILFLAASATGLINVPLTKLVEDAVCRQYYGRPDIEEQLCKLETIQSDVAFIFARMGVCEAVVALFTALPWGIAADRIGRKLVFSLALLGMALGVLFMMMVLWWEDVFPTAFVALGPVFYVIGGGNAVSMGILLSIVSNVIPDDQRAVAFMRLQVSGLVGSLISPALSSAMMAITGPWPVMPVAVACLVVGAMAFLFMPETVQHKDEDGEETGLDSPHIGFKDHTLRTLSQLKESLSILSSPSLFLLILTCLATTPLATGVLQFLVQFVSKRYSVPIKNTGYIQMAYGLLQIIQALIILPWISNLLLNSTIAPPSTSIPTIIHLPNEPKRDLLLAKYSFYSILIGFLILGFAPSIAVFMLGLTILAIGSCYNSREVSVSLVFAGGDGGDYWELVWGADDGGVVYAGDEAG